MGLIRGKKEYVGKRARTVYSITAEGLEELRAWLGTPVSPFAMDFEAMIRLFVAPLGTNEQLISVLRQVRTDTQEMLRFGGAVKQEFLEGIAATQDQVYIRALAVDFFISLLNTVDAWAERTLREIESWEDLTPDGKNERALELLRALPVPTPEDWTGDTPVPPRTQVRRHR
jgi:DNA-binding PadR family transcriptional regulator